MLVCSLTSCEKFLEIDPPKTSLSGSTVFVSDATATAAVVGIYERMTELTDRFQSGTSSVTLLTGLSSDEFYSVSTSSQQIEFYDNELLEDNNIVSKFWADLYEDIYSANAVLEGLEQSQQVTPAVRQQLEGEVKLIRALSYFYLVNLFGNVPYTAETDYKKNSLASPTEKSEIYAHIIDDLKDAQNLMAENYVYYERVRPNRLTATALLARVYLYLEDWANAEAEATSVIDNSLYEIGDDLNSTFLKESKEAIWQLQPVVPGYATYDGLSFIFSGVRRDVALSDEMLNAFETNDNRRTSWVGSRVISDVTYYYVYKYKVRILGNATDLPPEYLIVFRLAEQYLIRAEARAHQGEFLDSQEDLNVIRNRAGLPNTTASDEASLLQAIEQEKRIEFFGEWGHRWFDLKRTDRADAVLSTIKGSNWQSTDVLFPLPQIEMTLNPNLKPQNSGY